MHVIIIPDLKHADRSLLQHQGFLWFWFARVASVLAFQMLAVAIGWQVYDITHSAFDLGMIGLVQFVSAILLALPAGHLADRYDRRRLIFVCQIIEGFAIGLLAVGTFLHWFLFSTILVMLFLIAAARAFAHPTLQTLLPSLIPPALLPRAVAASASAGQSAMIVGPAIGGFLYIAGPDVVYGVSGLLCFAAAFSMWQLRTERPPIHREPPTLRTVFAGITFIRDQPVVLGAISLDLFAVLLGGATTLLPIFARDILHTGPWGLGLLRAAPAVGALTMSIWLAHYPLTRRVGHVMFAAVTGFGIATLIFALSRSFALSLTVLVILGACDMISVVVRMALVQLTTPNQMLGRVNAVNTVFVSTSNQLGGFESGVTAAWFGAVPAVLIGGIGTLIVVVLWMWWFPALRQRQQLHSNTVYLRSNNVNLH